jgi:magnesium-protoporphyrin IX monomethyl ester (oxidative) cyclase
MIDLVYPASVSGSENYSSEVPLGPVALYSSLPASSRSNVRFLDSTILSQDEIERAVTQRIAKVVALSCTTYNYRNALRVAALAKQNGSYVMCGGIHITYMRDAILRKMECGERPIDFLVTGFGEPAFGTLLTALDDGGSLDAIPNLSFVRNGRAVVNPTRNPRFGADPLRGPLDYSGIDFKQYGENFRPFGNLASARVPGSTFTQRGCAYSGKHKCTFCSIEEMNLHRAPECFEEDVVSLITRHNVDHIRITDADFTLDAHHMSRIADAATRAYDRTGERPVLHCFARSDEIDERRVEILKRLNVVSVLIGYESGSDRMLSAMQKHMTNERNLQATALLKEHGIDVICGGLVLGAEGETESTLSETLQFVKDLKIIGNTASLVASPLIPLPGSICFARLLDKLSKDDPGKFQELSVADDFDLGELIELWNVHMAHVPLVRLVEVSDEIAGMFRVGIRLIEMHH